MIILGVDPGTNKMGYGIIEQKGNKISYISSGILNLKKIKYLPTILDVIYKFVKQLCNDYKIEYLSIENAFYHLNVDAVMKIGYARGAAILSAVHSQVNIAEYSPREVKKAITGNGASTKQQVQYMVKKIINIDKTLNLDESDALAIALCHAFKFNTISHAQSNSWKKFIENNPERVII